MPVAVHRDEESISEASIAKVAQKGSEMGPRGVEFLAKRIDLEVASLFDDGKQALQAVSVASRADVHVR